MDQSFLLTQVLPATQLIPECCQGLHHYTAIDTNKIALETNENKQKARSDHHFIVTNLFKTVKHKFHEQYYQKKKR